MIITNEKMIHGNNGMMKLPITAPSQKNAQHPAHAPPVGLCPYRPQQQRRSQGADTRMPSEAMRRTHQLLMVGDTGAPSATQHYAREQQYNDPDDEKDSHGGCVHRRERAQLCIAHARVQQSTESTDSGAQVAVHP